MGCLLFVSSSCCTYNALETFTDIKRVFIQVDKKMFQQTQRTWFNYVLKKYVMDIQKTFGIDWPSIEWKDLRKPLYSALGARLYVSYKSRMSGDNIPRSIEEQARFWQTHYRPDGDEQHFNTLAMKLENRKYTSGQSLNLMDYKLLCKNPVVFGSYHEFT